jgi:hypothetical protein
MNESSRLHRFIICGAPGGCEAETASKVVDTAGAARRVMVAQALAHGKPI